MNLQSPAPAQQPWYESLRVYVEPRLLLILLMGFSSGLPLALTGATLQVWMTRVGVQLSTIGFFALVGTVYSLKFVWAPLLDQVELPGFLGRMGRRRGWALMSQILLTITIFALGHSDPLGAPLGVVVAAVAVAFFSATQDIVIDAYRIELLNKAQQGAGAAMTQYGYRLGMLASGAGALYLAEVTSWTGAYRVMAGLMSVGMIAVIFAPEPKASGTSGGTAIHWLVQASAVLLLTLSSIAAFWLIKFVVWKPWTPPAWASWMPTISATLLAAILPILLVASLPAPNSVSLASPTGRYYQALYTWIDTSIRRPFRDIATREGWAWILLFIVLYKLGDAVAGTMSNPFYVKMGFSNLEIATVSKVFGLIATLVGLFLGGMLNARVSLSRGLLICGLLQMVSNLMFVVLAWVGYDLHLLYVTIGFENLSGGMGSAVFVTFISLLCNTRFTGTQYALFSSLTAIGRTVLSSPGGVIVEQIGWANYFFYSTLAAFPGLLLLLYLHRRKILKSE